MPCKVNFVFIRAFGIAATIAAIWWSSSSFGLGLGLGELKVESTLASPLRASIPLRGMAEIDLDPELFVVTIESDARAKIEYRLERQNADTVNLMLYTREPISEPLFQFRVEIEWDRSSSARSYDVFIDPAVYDARTAIVTVPAPAVVEPASAQTPPVNADTDSTGTELPAADPGTAIALAGDPAATAAAAGQAVDSAGQADGSTAALEIDEPRRQYGPTIDGNSIWRVARAVATDLEDLNIYQWMHAIWKANPGAFYLANMHRLNTDELLEIPYESEVAEVSRREAYRIYKEQMALLEEMQPLSTLAATATDGGEATTLATDAQPVLLADAELAVVAAESPPGVDDPADAGLAAQDDAVEYLSEEAKLDAVMAIIEEIEQAEASIVLPSSAQVDAESVSEGQALPDLAEVMAQPFPTVSADEDLVASQQQLPDDPAQDAAIGVTVAPVLAVTADDAAATVAADSEGDWNSNLLQRQQLIAQLPVIGEQAPLAFLGRFVQWVDELVATSPSWAALAFGCWTTLVAFLLVWEVRARRRGAAMVAGTGGRPVLRSSPPPVMAPVAEAQALVMPASATPAADQQAALPKVNLKSDKDDQPDLNAEEILDKADRFMAAGDSGEAVKLLELAIKVQPDQSRFAIRLLEIHHKLKQADAFEALLQRMSPWFEALDISNQIHLQVMYAQLCPRATPLIDVEQAVKARARAEAEAEAAEEARLQGEVDLPTGSSKDNASNEDDDEDYLATQVLNRNGDLPPVEEVVEKPDTDDAALDLDLMLREVDVYLAYGLYDNAEELLLQGIEADPNRVDYLAKLLDTHFATKNLVDFVACAETLREMGEAANHEYWGRVEVMGYQLAPYNELFIGGKDGSLEGIDTGTTKPEFADVDLAGDVDLIGEGSEASAIEFNLDDEAAETSLQDLIEDAVDDDVAHDLDTTGALSTDELFVGDAAAPANDDSASSTELLDEIIAENETDDPTNLNLNLDETANINFAADETANINFDGDDPVTMDQYSDDDDADDEPLNLDELDGEDADLEFADVPEFDAIADAQVTDDDEVLDLDGLKSGLETIEFDNAPVLDAFDDSAQNIEQDEDESMKFTIAHENEAEKVDAVADTGAGGSTGDIADARILFFPESGSSRPGNAEFEADVKMTLQAIRDQLQYMTERLFRQERETSELRQAIQEITERGGAQGRSGNKKSS